MFFVFISAIPAPIGLKTSAMASADRKHTSHTHKQQDAQSKRKSRTRYCEQDSRWVHCHHPLPLQQRSDNGNREHSHMYFQSHLEHAESLVCRPMCCSSVRGGEEKTAEQQGRGGSRWLPRWVAAEERHLRTSCVTISTINMSVTDEHGGDGKGRVRRFQRTKIECNRMRTEGERSFHSGEELTGEELRPKQ
jgi:hypothetical protein